jgi:TusA-related sulfurtransferase
MIELFDDVKKAADNSNRGEFVEVKIDNLKYDFTTVAKEHDGRHQSSSAKAEGSSSEKAQEVSGSKVQSK